MLFIIDKHAAVDWTVGKLMTIILAIVLLALIIYGVSTGGINPLVEKAEGMFDNILVLFGAGEDGDGGEGIIIKEEVNISGVGTGVLEYSEDSCEIKFDDGSSYKLNYDTGNLERQGVVVEALVLKRVSIELANLTRNVRKALIEEEKNFILQHNDKEESISFFELLDRFKKTGEEEEFSDAIHGHLNKKGLLFFKGEKKLLGWRLIAGEWSVPPLLHSLPVDGWSYGIDDKGFLYRIKPEEEWYKFEDEGYNKYIYFLDFEWRTMVKYTKIKQFLNKKC